MIDIEQAGQPTLFDYAALDSETSAFLQEQEAELDCVLKRTTKEIGEILLRVKKRLPHGKYMPWLTSRGISQQTAWRCMQEALGREIKKSPKMSDLPSPQLVFSGASDPNPDTSTEESTDEKEQTAQDRYMTAVDMGTTDYYYDDLRREALKKDEEEREARRQQQRDRLSALRAQGVALPTGKYSCLVVDPPWPMQKIERDVRPNQVEFDYPTMSEDELCAFPLPDMAADDCHLYLWTTQKFLPMALRLAEHWGFKYQCLMTWVKNVGFTPYSWMYSTEHVLFCTRGSLPLLALGKRLDFTAKVREHSRKPDEFYDLVREVSPGPRLDVFSREKRDGFEQYGNEVEKYVSA